MGRLRALNNHSDEAIQCVINMFNYQYYIISMELWLGAAKLADLKSWEPPRILFNALHAVSPS